MNRATRWITRGGLYLGQFDEVVQPRSVEEAKMALHRATERARIGGGHIAFIGARRSFAPHFLPSDDSGDRLGIDCSQLTGVVEVYARSEEDLQRDVLRVRALGGTSLAQLLEAVRPHGDFFPFSFPTASAITLAGALAANTHSRSSATYGGLFADHVLAIRLLTADGQDLELRRDELTGLKADLFRYVPGSLGALGLIAELELELTRVHPQQVEAEVLVRRENDHLSSLDDYLDLVANNRMNDGFVHEEGYGLVFFGNPCHGASLVMGRRRTAPKPESDARMPLFSGSRRRAALIQGLAHRFPRVGQGLAAKLLPKGKKFQSEFQRWALFQDSYDDATDLARDARGTWKALVAIGLIDPKMTVVHQAWVTPTETVRKFMGAHLEQLSQPMYAPLRRRVEFQDLVPLPQGPWPMSPNYAQEKGAHCFALSFSSRQDRSDITRLGKKYCAELSERVYSLGTKVQLIKQLHVDPELLRQMYHAPLQRLRELRQEVDPSGLISSASIVQLGL